MTVNAPQGSGGVENVPSSSEQAQVTQKTSGGVRSRVSKWLSGKSVEGRVAKVDQTARKGMSGVASSPESKGISSQPKKAEAASQLDQMLEAVASHPSSNVLVNTAIGLQEAMNVAQTELEQVGTKSSSL